MNIIKKIFGFKQNNGTTMQTETDPVQNIEIDENLFKDNGAPEKKEIAVKSPGILGIFMEKDFYSAGYNDGYDYHSASVMESSIQKIKSDFMFIADKLIDVCNSEIIMLSDFIKSIEGMNTKSIINAENRITELRKLISKLMDEKDYCQDEKGIVLKALSDYRSGYEKGLYSFTEEKLMGIPTGLY